MYRKGELVLLLLLLVGLVAASRRLEQSVSSEKVEQQEDIVVIDSGHGGNDPGKIGVNGAKEKEINLQIAKKVKTLLEEKKIKVVMTR